MFAKLLLAIAVVGTVPCLRGQVFQSQGSGVDAVRRRTIPSMFIRDTCDDLCKTGGTFCCKCADNDSTKCCPQGYICDSETRACKLPCDDVVCDPGQTCKDGACTCVDTDCKNACGTCSGPDCKIPCGNDPLFPGTECNGETGSCECTNSECGLYCSSKGELPCCANLQTCACCPSDQFCFTGRGILRGNYSRHLEKATTIGVCKRPCDVINCNPGETCLNGKCYCNNYCGQIDGLRCFECKAGGDGVEKCVPKTCNRGYACETSTGNCNCDVKSCSEASCGRCDSNKCVPDKDCLPNQICNAVGEKCECTLDFCAGFCKQKYPERNPCCQDEQCICLIKGCPARTSYTFL